MESDDSKLLNLDLAIAQKRVQEVLISIQTQPMDTELIEEGLSAASAMKALAAVKGVPHLESFAAQLNQAFLTVQNSLAANRPVKLQQILTPIARSFNKACTMMGDPTDYDSRQKVSTTKLDKLADRIRRSSQLQQETPRHSHVKTEAQADEVTLVSIFQGFIPWIRQAAAASDKQIRIHIRTPETAAIPAEKAVVIQIILIHLLRNAIFHGIEPADIRAVSHKAVEGTLEWRAEIEDNYLVMVLSDDGKGMDSTDTPEPVFSLDCFTSVSNDTMADTSIYSLTNQQTGLGLGLHIVKTQAEKLGGEMLITSAPGIGTSIKIQIPVSKLS